MDIIIWHTVSIVADFLSIFKCVVGGSAFTISFACVSYPGLSKGKYQIDILQCFVTRLYLTFCFASKKLKVIENANEQCMYVYNGFGVGNLQKLNCKR